MKIIGLTGKSGAGKGTVAAIFEKNGIPHIDCDKIYHSLIDKESSLCRELSHYFGVGILKEDGSVDRKALGELVFGEGNEVKLAELNRITHKQVLNRCRTLIAEHKKNGAKAVIVDAPTLFESGFDSECDIIVAVEAELSRRLERITDRDSISDEIALKRLLSQGDDSFYTERADFVINNDSDLSHLTRQAQKIIEEILN